MRILIAPDAFKGSLAAPEVADALACGARRALGAHKINTIELPMSDGGEGLLGVIAANDPSWSWHQVTVTSVDTADPGVSRDARQERGKGTVARFLISQDGLRAFGAVSEVVGVHLTESRSPTVRTAWGVGEYLEGIRRVGAPGLSLITLGIGGTATIDGGFTVLAGMGLLEEAAASTLLRWPTERDAEGTSASPLAPKRLGETHWSGISLRLWCDVTTPLVGPNENVMTYASQKGATFADVTRLGSSLDSWVRAADPELAKAAYTGAGGGIPYGLMWATGSTCVPGAEELARLLDLDGKLSQVDMVWTGEGAIDRTTAEGKLVDVVVSHAQRAGVPVTVFAGRADLPTRTYRGCPIVDLSARFGKSVSLSETTQCLTLAAFQWLTESVS